MIKQLQLQNFKSFRDATLEVGPFTLLVGANASGKSNVRDAFRFLHGIGRGYSLAEIVGEKRTEGEKVWGGIRGGIPGLVFQDEKRFSLEVEFTIHDFEDATTEREMYYFIEVQISAEKPLHMQLAGEQLIVNDNQIFLARKTDTSPPEIVAHNIRYQPDQPVLSQCLEWDATQLEADVTTMQQTARRCLDVFRSMRFLAPDPAAMRQPATPGQAVLSDRGENLASVLHWIMSDPQQKAAFREWLQELTPMDACDFEFPADPAGRILLTLVERNGQRTPAYSASDGTLRFLALLAALLGPQPARLYFLEELESGIHPTRLRLLLNLIEQRVAQAPLQVIASTHSPQLLLLVEPETLEHVALTYRPEGRPDTRLQRVLDLRNARHLIETQDVGRLHESGWLEDAAEFLADEEESTAGDDAAEHVAQSVQSEGDTAL